MKIIKNNSPNILRGFDLEKGEHFKGGVADGKTIEDIAKKHGKEVSFLKTQLQAGMKVEKEHTDNEGQAREIALDHLYEDCHYYHKLAKMEKK